MQLEVRGVGYCEALQATVEGPVPSTIRLGLLRRRCVEHDSDHL